MRELKDGIRALVRLDYKGDVRKTFRGTDADARCQKEAEVLRVLEERGCPNVPRLVSHDQEALTIVTTSCGSPAPNITRGKADALFAELEEKFGVRHDDPEPRNVTYSPHMGCFCLIDFELAEILPMPGEGSPAEKPEGLRCWRATWAARSTRGRDHEANDDRFLIYEVTPEGARQLPDQGEELLDPAHLILAVSDGMGGRNAGDFASSLIMSWIRRHAANHYGAMEKGENEALGELMRNAHEGLLRIAGENEKAVGMGATLTLAWITSTRVHIGQVGDSRLYRARTGKTDQLTKDDCSAWYSFQRGEITEYAYRTHPRRAALTQALGGANRSLQPKISSFEIHSGDRFLLSSDGLVDGLWERHIREGLASAENPRALSKRLVEKSNENNNKDDTTVIVAELRSL